MILKKAAHPPTDDKFQVAGQKAEKQLAYYLERAFGQDPGVHVLNDLRIEKGKFGCQMDHLILHPFGWIIIESKSVISEVQINAHGEWSRKWNGQFQGMASPVRQAERQLELFHDFLDQGLPEQLKGSLGAFRSRDHQSAVLVAISDRGLISGNHRPAGVLKADAVVDEVKALIQKNQKAARALLSFRRYRTLNENALLELGRFLVTCHKPLNWSGGTPKAVTSTSEKPSFPSKKPVLQNKKCRVCQGQRLEVRKGVSGHYLHCLDCEQNTPL